MRVFISYHHSRQSTAEHVARYLDSRGVATWIAPRDIVPGGDWDDAVTEAITHSSALVLLFCSEADQSRHVKREIHLADHANIPVYPVRLERIEPQKLGYFLTSAQWIDWLDQRDSALDTLIRAVTSRSPEPGLGAATIWSPVKSEVAPSTQWPRLLAVFPSESDASEAAARIVFECARRYPEHTVLLPTGRTATQLFRAMVRVAPEYKPGPFGDCIVIADTETFGVYSKHSTSRTRHVQESLLNRLDANDLAPPHDQVQLLSGLIGEVDPIARTNRVLRDHPPAVHVISVSPTGEVLGYDVGTYSDNDTIVHDGCRIIEVSHASKLYIDGDQPSRSIITIGLGTALDSRVLVLPVLTVEKARILHHLVSFRATSGVPATLLRRHPTAIVCTTERVTDEADLSDIAVKYSNPEEFLSSIAEKDVF